jgi:hypothetical protein
MFRILGTVTPTKPHWVRSLGMADRHLKLFLQSALLCSHGVSPFFQSKCTVTVFVSIFNLPQCISKEFIYILAVGFPDL